MLHKTLLKQIFFFMHLKCQFLGGLIGGALGFFGAGAAGASTATSIGAGLVGSQIGGAYDANSARTANTRDANELNYRMFLESQRYNAAEAEKQRKWQIWQSNYAIQRQVGDMKKAGINPILAAQYGGANAGTGATASTAQPSAQTPNIENIMANNVSSANQWRQSSSVIGLQKQQTQKVSAEISNVMADTEFKKATTNLTNDNRLKVAEEMARIRVDIKHIIETTRGKKQLNDIKQVFSDLVNSAQLQKLARDTGVAINVLIDLATSTAESAINMFKSHTGSNNSGGDSKNNSGFLDSWKKSMQFNRKWYNPNSKW